MSSPTVGPEIGTLELQSQPAGSSHPICPPNRRPAVRAFVRADRELESLPIMTGVRGCVIPPQPFRPLGWAETLLLVERGLHGESSNRTLPRLTLTKVMGAGDFQHA